VLAVVVTLVLIAFLTANHRFKAAQIESQLQVLQLNLLERSLETESLISAASLEQLQQALSGESLSSIATLTGSSPDGTAISLVAVWSDSAGSGHLVLPADMTAGVPAAQIEIHGTFFDQSSPLELSVVQAEHPRIIGFQQPADTSRLEHLQLIFRPADESGSSITLEGALER
jgi:hypothetical protein